ncbi:COX15/CtaA family protein [Novipirellula artificiosorum]|uniref:Heme A synthase n=1 Tax=Novipirellula artificiosorum TaxID=2528016 RepID=A0A5C6E3C6_9BACT|nr:COX15/CtaA family protein [Novipirellula artificiosorum]TWU42141.1 Heme A synthase [Novipirellula artificiosorum]
MGTELARDKQLDAASTSSRTVHRLAVLTVVLIWPLIWVGGLVTTYDAGMAVPDWPNTFGYNLFLYPYKTWLLGPFDLFIEHGHRLLGALVGFTAIGLVVSAAMTENRRWVKILSVVILLLVIIQGGLGGIRVMLSDRVFAMIHGSTAPLVFAIAVAGAVVTSRWWRKYASDSEQGDSAAASFDLPKVPIGAIAVTVILLVTCYIQLVVGAKIRHLQPTDSSTWFLYLVWIHVISAFVIWILTAVVWQRLRGCGDLSLSRNGTLLVGLTAIQVLLGIVTWVVNYGWPSFLKWFPGASGHLVESKNYVDAWLVTAHVATGPLILAMSTVVFLRILRVRYLSRHSSH